MTAKSLLILGLAAVGSSFRLPDGLPNGSYQAYYNEAGEEIHELISETILNSTTSHQVLSKRQFPLSKRSSIQTWCGCDNPMNAGDTNVANEGLANQAASGPRIDPGTSFYTIQNTAVAFVCNGDDKPLTIPTDVVSTGSWDVSAACGLFYAGTSRLEWPEMLDYGYMNYVSGLDFCHDAERSTSSTCQQNFWIGGYGGEFEAGPIGVPSIAQMGGTWVGTALNCDDVSTGSPFPEDTNNIGEEEYNWCNINFRIPDQTDITMYMGGDGNRCGQVCNSADACPDGGFFAQVLNADGDVPVGACTYDSSWNTDCVSDGSLMYSSAIHCTYTP